MKNNFLSNINKCYSRLNLDNISNIQKQWWGSQYTHSPWKKVHTINNSTLLLSWNLYTNLSSTTAKAIKWVFFFANIWTQDLIIWKHTALVLSPFIQIYIFLFGHIQFSQ